VSAVQALSDRRRGLRRSTERFHADRPCFGFSPIGFTRRFDGAFARAFRALMAED
jgi:hypothetical protein